MVSAAERRTLPDILTWHYYPGQSDRAISLPKWRRAALVTAAALLVSLTLVVGPFSSQGRRVWGCCW